MYSFLCWFRFILDDARAYAPVDRVVCSRTTGHTALPMIAFDLQGLCLRHLILLKINSTFGKNKRCVRDSDENIFHIKLRSL